MDIALIGCALLVGVIVGATGVGGGSLMTPLLIMAFHIPPPVAVATDLLFAAGTKIVGAAEYARRRLVDWKITSLMWLGSLPASALTVMLLPGLADLDTIIRYSLAVALLLTAVVMLFRPLLNRWLQSGLWHVKRRGLVLVVFSALLGVMVTISSVGAGALGLALLALLYPERRVAELVAIDLAHTVVLSTIAGVGHLSEGRVDFNLLATLLVGSLPGVWLGARLGPFLNEKWLVGIFLLAGSWLIAGR